VLVIRVHAPHTRSIPGRSTSPTARALRALALIQASPGITAERLGLALGVTERAARRYVAILREAELPIESVSGPYGGYRVGRGLRLPPLMFSAAEAVGLTMATLEGHRDAADPTDLVGGALAKLLGALPARVADPVRAVVPTHAAPGPPVSAEFADRLLGACTAARRVRLLYRTARSDREMDVDPWAVLLRHSSWYLLCWSHTADAQRVLRIDRVLGVEPLPETFAPPPDLDALRVLEEHLSQGWTHDVDVLVEAPPYWVARWVPRSLARLFAEDGDRSRMVATTNDADWYARQLAQIPVEFHVVGSPELRRAVADLGDRMGRAASGGT
jgi:predicted DNA-binding transcriptional regulator YafY